MKTQEILAQWRTWQESQHLSERTIDAREKTIRHLLDFTGAEPLAVAPNDIMLFVGRSGPTATSASTYHASIRAYCAWLVRTDRRLDDPSMKTPAPKRPKSNARPLPTGNVVLLLAAASRRRTRMMILLATMAGLRVHEIAKFHGEDIDLVNGSITVTGKGGSTELIPAHESIIAEAGSFPRFGYWFASYDEKTRATGEPHVSRFAVYAAIKGAMKRAGVTGTPHQLRHWYGTKLLNEGVDIRIVQELMRHKTIATTQLYTRVHWEQMVAGLRRLDLPTAA